MIKELHKASLLALGLVVIASSFVNNPVFAAINFKSGPTCGFKSGSNQLECTGRVTGLGNTASATLSAQAVVTQGCANRGANNQQPSGLQRTSQPVTASQSLSVHSGGASFDLIAPQSPITPTIHCPDQMTPVIVCVQYTFITVTITSSTGSKRATAPDVSNC